MSSYIENRKHSVFRKKKLVVFKTITYFIMNVLKNNYRDMKNDLK